MGGSDKGLLVGCDYVDLDAGFQVGEICSASQSVLRGEFVKYRSGCDDLDEFYEVANDLTAGDGRRSERCRGLWELRRR